MIQSHNPALIASTAPNSPIFSLACPSLHFHADLKCLSYFFISFWSPHISVWMWMWWRWGFRVKGLQWSWECGKPPLVWSNHSQLSIILPPSLPQSNLSTHHSSKLPLPPPSIIPTSLVRKLGWHSVALPLHHFPLLLHLPPFYFSPITPSSLVGIWRVTLGQFNLSSPSATQPASVPQPFVCGHTSPAGHHSVFYTSHLPCSPLLHRTFHFLICHSCFPFTCPFFFFFFKLPTDVSRPEWLRENVMKMPLLYYFGNMLYCATALIKGEKLVVN